MRINWNLYELLADRLPAAIGGVHCSNLLNHTGWTEMTRGASGDCRCVCTPSTLTAMGNCIPAGRCKVAIQEPGSAASAAGLHAKPEKGLRS